MTTTYLFLVIFFSNVTGYYLRCCKTVWNSNVLQCVSLAIVIVLLTNLIQRKDKVIFTILTNYGTLDIILNSCSLVFTGSDLCWFFFISETSEKQCDYNSNFWTLKNRNFLISIKPLYSHTTRKEEEEWGCVA